MISNNAAIKMTNTELSTQSVEFLDGAFERVLRFCLSKEECSRNYTHDPETPNGCPSCGAGARNTAQADAEQSGPLE